MYRKQEITFTRFRLIFLYLSVWILSHFIYQLADGLPEYKGKADVAVVLGNKVYIDGSLSPWLKLRVNKAFELFKAGRVKKIFVSGGIEKEGQREGDAMKNYLVQKGVPDAAVIKDNAGVNSYATAKNFIALSKKENFSSAVIVTHFYHVPRCKYIFNKLGFKNVYSASSDGFAARDITGIIRDMAAYYKYVLVY